MTTDYLPDLPAEVTVPEWVRDDSDVELPVLGLKVSGTLNLRALLPNDVLVTGTLVYRGNEYRVRYEHTTDEGDPYIYDAQGNNRVVLTTIPEDGWQAWRIGEWLGTAPKSYRAPLMEAVRDTVQRYVREYQGHVRKMREANLIQNVNRKATEYNRKAEEAAKALAEYEATVEALEAFHHTHGEGV
jgi:hypothetical protein